jgi:putative PIN family toxin of toxin-antitoxin system
MLRAVLDNVVVSAHLRADGPASLLFRLALSGYFQCFVADDLFQEYSEVLLREKFMLDAGDVKRSLQSFRAAAIITPYERIFAARDPDDNKVLECATEADAQYIVTGNIRDFPQVFHGVAVVLPRRFLDIRTAQP